MVALFRRPANSWAAGHIDDDDDALLYCIGATMWVFTAVSA